LQTAVGLPRCAVNRGAVFDVSDGRCCGQVHRVLPHATKPGAPRVDGEIQKTRNAWVLPSREPAQLTLDETRHASSRVPKSQRHERSSGYLSETFTDEAPTSASSTTTDLGVLDDDVDQLTCPVSGQPAPRELSDDAIENVVQQTQVR